MTDYYRNNYQAYFDSTITVDPSGFLNPLAKRLTEGASVLDVGCGSGRDLIWMKNRGYRPAGFEQSSGLARLAREASGCSVIEGDFETFDFTTLSADAILLVTALVHVPHERLADVVANITMALIPGGFMLLSLKEGTGVITDRMNRTFYFWQKEELATLLESLGFKVIETMTNRSAIRSEESIISILLQSK